MRATSDLYKQILADPDHKTETRLLACDKDLNIDALLLADLENPTADRLSEFGTSVIAFGEDVLCIMSTKLRVFSDDTLKIGSCVSAEINIKMLNTDKAKKIPRQAKLVPQVRLVNGNQKSEWLSKGVFYVDTRDHTGEGGESDTLDIHGYDGMMKTEQDYPKSSLKWPSTEMLVVQEIEEFIGVGHDARNIYDGYTDIQYPAGYSCREVLGYIAAINGGCFVMNDIGALRLIKMSNFKTLKKVVLTNELKAPLLFGKEAILV